MLMRWVRRALAVLAMAVIVSVGGAWIFLHASLPMLDGEVETAGIAAGATLERDRDGVVTIRAKNRRDAAFATGFAHGQDRFFQMDLMRRQSAGELAALIGPAAISADRRARLHRFRSRARDAVNALDDNGRTLLERYTDGVNAGLGNLRARPFEYALLATKPKPWSIEDAVLVVYTMFMELNDERATKDLQRGYAHRVLPPDVFAWLYPNGTSWDAPLMGEPRDPEPLPSADRYAVRDITDRSEPAHERGKDPLAGSNNWAVGGTLTRSGRAIVANDMHLGLGVPNIFFRARIVVEAESHVDVSGVTLPGTPFVVAGSNGNIAWGYTNSYGDWTDAVLLRPGERPDSYITPDGDRDYRLIREQIAVRNAEPVELVIRETDWGPVLDDTDYPDGDIAIRWTAHDAESVNLNLIDLETANSVRQALDVANSMGIPPQNFVVGDAAGNIGWTIAGRIPIRTDYDPTLPSDWSTGHGWTGWLSPGSYPRLVNPPGGRIWTANARVADGEALARIGDGGYDLGARAGQIRDRLYAQEQFDPADMLAIQYDDRAVFLTRWRDLLLDVLDAAAVSEDAALAEYRRLAAGWLPRAAAASVGYRLVRAFRLEVQARVFHGLTGPIRAQYGDAVDLRMSNQFEAVLWKLLANRPQHLLPGAYASWDELLLDAVRANLRYFETRFDGPLSQRTWGERNIARIRHPLSRAIPGLGRWLDMPARPLNGDLDMPKAQSPSFGASERFAVAPGDEANGILHMPTGQSGHPLSAFYRRGHALWVEGRSSPFLPGPTRHRLFLMPAT